MSPPKGSKGCYNCMRRRIICDRTEPHCNKCAKKGLVCPGFGIRYRYCIVTSPPDNDQILISSISFNDGLAARGKLKGKVFKQPGKTDTKHSSPSTSGATTPRNLTWVVDGVHEVKEPKTAKRQSSKPETLDSTLDVDNDAARQSREGSIEVDPVLTSMTDVEELPPLRPCLQMVDARTRQLFDHFANYVSPVMILIDDLSNGYRHIILPMAVADPVVSRAVCVASAFHLSIQQPQLKFYAEAGRATIITKLKSMAAAGNVFTLSTWATIILLLVGELVNGSEDILTLYRMLMSFMQAKPDIPDDTPVGWFLGQQTDLIEFFTQPVIDETKGAQKLLEAASPTATNPEWPDASALREDVYSEAYHQACQIYVLRAQSEDNGFDDDFAISLVTKLKDLLDDVDPNSAGAYTLVWPYFVAAAESVLEAHRTFFYERLEHIWITTKYRNVKIALDALPAIWSNRGRKRWTKMLIDDIAMVVM